MDYNKMTKAELIEALKSLQSPRDSEHPASELQVHQINEILTKEIAERRRAERESEARIRAILNTAVDGVITISDGGLVESFNSAAERIFGYGANEVIGQNVKILMSAPYHDEHDRYLANYLSTGEKKIIGIGREVIGRRKDDTTFPMEIAVSEVWLDERRIFTGFVRDLTARKRAEEELQKSEERFRSLIQTAGNVIICLSPDHRILEWNLEAERVYGWRREEVLGRDYYELFLPAEIRETVAADMQKVLAGEPIRNFENPILTRDGRTRLLTWNAVHLRNDQNQPNGVICIGHDITETKNLTQAAQRMERLAVLGQFAATLAHELRNLLGSIILNFDHLAEQLKNSERYKKTFNNIEQGIARIQNLINGVLDFARPAPPALEKANLHKVLDRSLQVVKQELERAGIAIQKNYAAIQPDVWLDGNQMMQVFINLFLNAKDAMYAGGNLTINTTCSESGIEVHIVDSGKGIPPENLEKIFDPFFTTRPEGIGLGLAVVARILEQHQAHILVESKVGVGTKFVIKFSSVMKHDNEP